MAKKLKDYYDETFLDELIAKIASVYPHFDKSGFKQEVMGRLEKLEFTPRQVLVAEALKAYIPLSYRDSLAIFEQILGPELETSIGMFTEGYWLWPIGKYVELYGLDDFETSTAFLKELTKRHTGEFGMRQLLLRYPEKTIALAKIWCQDEDSKVRRLACECLRVALPWAKKTTIALEHFEDYVWILTSLKDDEDKSIQKSVANNLNDLSKVDVNKFNLILRSWTNNKEVSLACQWIIKHGSRTIRKMQYGTKRPITTEKEIARGGVE